MNDMTITLRSWRSSLGPPAGDDECRGSHRLFLTPAATPVNLMVMGPAGYRFGDYWKLRLPLMVWFFIVATFLVPFI